MESPRRVAVLLILVTALACAGQLNGGPARDTSISRTTEGQEFAVAFDKYVHDDSIVGAAYVLVKDGRMR